jgi:hypothetical protein
MICTMSDAAPPAEPHQPDALADRASAGDRPDRHPWSDGDRPRGLDAYFPPGGEDDAPPERVADERRLTRLLVLMILLLVGIPTLLTLIAFIAQLAALRGG